MPNSAMLRAARARAAAALLLACAARAAPRGCALWPGAICDHLKGFDVSDRLSAEAVCHGLCLNHRNCDKMVRDHTAPVRRGAAPAPHSPIDLSFTQCKCVVLNYEATCDCDIGECAGVRERQICELGCPYFDSSCKALVRPHISPSCPSARRAHSRRHRHPI